MVTERAHDRLGLVKVKFGANSFRIGAASVVAVMGYFAAKIQQLDRWSLASFKSYVRSIRYMVHCYLFLVIVWVD